MTKTLGMGFEKSMQLGCADRKRVDRDLTTSTLSIMDKTGLARSNLGFCVKRGNGRLGCDD